MGVYQYAPTDTNYPIDHRMQPQASACAFLLHAHHPSAAGSGSLLFTVRADGVVARSHDLTTNASYTQTAQSAANSSQITTITAPATRLPGFPF